MPQLRKQVVCALLFFWRETAKKITAIHCRYGYLLHSLYRYKDITDGCRYVTHLWQIYGSGNNRKKGAN